VLDLYSKDCFIRHNQAACDVSDSSIRIVTPESQWAYAVEFPLQDGANLPSAGATIKIVARLISGSAGIGLLNHDGTVLLREAYPSDGPGSDTINIPVLPAESAGSLVVRNLSVAGQSCVEIERISCDLGAQEKIEDIVIDPQVFAPFKPWSGTVNAGFWADWSGIITRADVWAFTAEVLAIYNADRVEAPPIPVEAEFLMDWAPLAEAVGTSGSAFRMAALGAGWGRWLSGGGQLARQLGREYFLIGVEADRQHFLWMQRHFAENGFAPNSYLLIEAAASGKPGFCYFAVGDNAAAWYGQAIIDEKSDCAKRRVAAITMADLVVDGQILDYLHMDIQGAELDFLTAYPQILDSHVKTVNIGTHSPEIEAGLRRLFGSLGWLAAYDVPMGSKVRAVLGDEIGPIAIMGDGAQVWKNPKTLSP
jgi:FkbM family methyltransferase